MQIHNGNPEPHPEPKTQDQKPHQAVWFLVHLGVFGRFLDVFGMILMGETNNRAYYGGCKIFVIPIRSQPNEDLSGGQGLRK